MPNIRFSIISRIKKFYSNYKKLQEVKLERERVLVSNIIIAVLTERKIVREGLLLFPRGSSDSSVCIAYHALCHFEADDDIKAKDTDFKSEQVEFLEFIAFTLKDGEPLPENILEEYKPYYKDTPIFFENSLLVKFKRMLRTLNL